MSRARTVALHVAVMAACVVPLFAQPGNPFPRPTPCTPRAELHGRDTLLAMLPCNSLARLNPAFRLVAECAIARMKAGGWDIVIYETYRSDERQQFLYSYGRTRPGPKVTNASTARMGAHFSGDALDAIHRKKLWAHPRFFYWWGQHLEACGAVAGVFWKSLPDGPHGQSRTWHKPRDAGANLRSEFRAPSRRHRARVATVARVRPRRSTAPTHRSPRRHAT